jgi:hypothetical protein
MTARFDISGAWRGFYEHDGGRHGISMQVAQRGESFVGRMRDHDTVLSGSKQIARIVKDDGSTEMAEVETMGVLPEHSIVEGTVDGDGVGFDKRYQGTHTISVWVPGRGGADHEIAEHTVRYEGRLRDGGKRLIGEWRIPSPGGRDATGAFELVRE